MTPRSWLYCPGNAPGKIINAGIYGADGIILDLEDAVASENKDEARHMVAEALRNHDFGPCVIGVRINAVGTQWWEDDLRALVTAGANLVRIPKLESGDALRAVSTILDGLEAEEDRIPGNIRVQCILETPRGIEEAFAVAEASPRLEGLCFGAEDYCTNVGIQRGGPEFALDYPRSRITCAAAAVGIAAYDTVWSAFRDSDGLRRDSVRARALGFDGKSLIHPDQVDIVNETFSYSEDDIAWAKRVLEEVGAAEGAKSVDGAMVDLPVIRRAQRIIASVSGDPLDG